MLCSMLVFIYPELKVSMATVWHIFPDMEFFALNLTIR